jgi:hypothetical protein
MVEAVDKCQPKQNIYCRKKKKKKKKKNCERKLLMILALHRIFEISDNMEEKINFNE